MPAARHRWRAVSRRAAVKGSDPPGKSATTATSTPAPATTPASAIFHRRIGHTSHRLNASSADSSGPPLSPAIRAQSIGAGLRLLPRPPKTVNQAHTPTHDAGILLGVAGLPDGCDFLSRPRFRRLSAAV